MLGDLVDLVLPRRCVGCGSRGRPLCATCAAARPVERYIAGVGTVHAAGVYEAQLRRAIVAYKERGRRELAASLGDLLATSAVAAIDDRAAVRPVVVAVPSSGRSRAERGFDHLRPLARIAAAGVGARAVAGLRVVRPMADTAGLGRRERRHNLAGAFAASPAPEPGATALLVDDVITTGASIREATRALRLAGWTVVGTAVIAATPRRTPRDEKPAAPAGLGHRTDYPRIPWPGREDGDTVNTT